MATPTLQVDIAFTTDPGTDPPVWTTLVEDDVRSVNIRRGKSSELEQVGAGTATIVLDNRARKYDPTYTSGPYFGNLNPMKRVRVKATYGGATEELFNGFVESFEQSFPGGVDQITVLTAVDGFKVLALADIPVERDFPEVIEDVFAPVWGYWSCGDKPGVKVIPGGWVKRKDNKDRDKKPQRKWRKARRLKTVSGDVGPEGIAVNTPTFQQHGGTGAFGIVEGTMNTGIQFTRASSEFVKFPVSDNDDLPGSNNNIAYHVIVRPTSLALNTQIYIGGPLTTGNLVPWQLGAINSGGALHFFSLIQFSDATSSTITEAVLTLDTDTFYELTATWNGTTDEHQLFLGFDLIASSTNAGKTIRTGVTPGHVYLGGHKAFTDATGTGRYADVVIAHAVVSERAFSNDSGGSLDELIPLEFSRAAGEGNPALVNSSGEQIEAILDATMLYPFTSADVAVDAGAVDVLPQRFDGATLVDLFRDLEVTEDGFLFTSKEGVLTFYDFSWRAGGGASSQGTFSNVENAGGGIPYADVRIARDDGFIYNNVTVTRDSEDAIAQENTDSTSRADYLRRRLDIADTLHVSDADADTLSARLLARYKDPAERVYEMTLLGGAGQSSGMVDAVWNQILQRDLFEKVTVKKHHRVSHAEEMSVTARVIGIEIDINPYREWSARWALMPGTY